MWFKHYVNHKINQKILTDLEIGKLHFSWFEGVRIYSIALYPETISNEPFINIDKIDLYIRFFEDFSLKPRVKINLQGIKINFVRYSEKTNNLSNWLEKFTKNDQNKHIDLTPKKQNTSLNLPFNIESSLSMTGLSIDYQDNYLKKKIALRDSYMMLSSNSILKRAINLQISSDIVIDKKESFSLKLGMRLSNILNRNKRIRIDDGFIFIDQNSQIRLKGELNHNLSFVNFEIAPFILDCYKIYPKVKRFLPEKILFNAHDMPVIEINQIQWTKNILKKVNRLKLNQISVNSNQLSYNQGGQQILARKIAFNIKDLIIALQSNIIMDIFVKGLSVNIPEIEIMHNKVGKIKERLIINADINKICLNIKELESTRTSGIKASFIIGNALSIAAESLEMKDQKIAFDGNIAIDLKEISNKLPLFRKKNDIKLNGKTSISWKIHGRLPEKMKSKISLAYRI